MCTCSHTPAHTHTHARTHAHTHTHTSRESDITLFTAAIKVNSNNGKLYSNLGHQYEQMKNFSYAEQLFRRGTEIQPDDVGAYMNLGRALKALGRIPEAEQVMLCGWGELSLLENHSPSPLTITTHHHHSPSPLTITTLHHHSPSPLTITTLHHHSPSPLTITTLHHHSPSPLTITTHHHY